jgi:hypothetical protein
MMYVGSQKNTVLRVIIDFVLAEVGTVIPVTLGLWQPMRYMTAIYKACDPA